jgi:hypothetical protein
MYMEQDEIIEKLGEFQACVKALPQHLQTVAFSKLIDNWLGSQPTAAGGQKKHIPSPPNVDSNPSGGISFGEYFTGFQRDIRNDQKLLIAGYYVQSLSQDGAFTVRDANKCLMDDGVKLSNPSEFCRMLAEKRYVFRVGKVGETQSKFKVSKEGFEHINSLKVGVE